MTAVTFIMPVRHPQGVRDPEDQQRILGQTLRSVAAQRGADWRLRIVCNPEQRLPPLPARAERVEVAFDPVPRRLAEAATDMAGVYAPFNFDRGRRIQAGAAGLGPEDVVMPIDDDDFLHRRLAAHLAASAARGGSAWLAGPGYVLRDGAWLMRRASAPCHRFMGTSVAFRMRRIAGLGDPSPSPETIRDVGGHGRTAERLLADPEGAEILPFASVIYRVDHGNQLQVDTARFRAPGQVAGLRPRPRSGGRRRDLAYRLRHVAEFRALHPLICRAFFGGWLPPAGPASRPSP